MSFSRYNSNFSSIKELDPGYLNNWYDECTCCPYGYHIDLDFVRYCESISREDQNRTGSIKRRKDRRKQRQSMEMLLGLTPPVLAVLDQAYSEGSSYSPESSRLLQKQATSPKQFSFCNDGFDDAVSDFERALQRSKNKLSNNLPDVTAVSENLRRVPSFSSIASCASGSVAVTPKPKDGILKSDLDAVSIESCGLSSMALQNIREALALSLERTKQLENEVKLVPQLQDQIETLRLENQRLKLKLKAETSANSINFNGNCIQTGYKKLHNFTQIDGIKSIVKEPEPHLARRDIGVMCGVLTRTIGVGQQHPNTKNASTVTTELGDKWIADKASFLNLNLKNLAVSLTKGTQTFLVKEKRDMGIQSSLLEPKKVVITAFTQTSPIFKPTVLNVGILAVAQKADYCVQKNIDVQTVGSSEDTIDDIMCGKCCALKKTVAVGPDRREDAYTSSELISLSALGNRSKSFNLGEDRLDLHRRTRTVASQYDHNLNKFHKSCQVETRNASKATQHEIVLVDKNTQFEVNSTSKCVDTKDLQPLTKSIACEAREEKKLTTDRASNTSSPEKEVSEEKICAKCSSKEMESSRELRKDETGSPTPSRIPIPTTPIEARKFRRQDTYTKIYSSSPTEQTKLSGLDISPKAVSTESISPFEQVKQNLKLDVPAKPSSSKSHNTINFAAVTKSHIRETTLPVSESTIFQTSASNRNKAIPSREMQGAMKVLNDYLHKSPARIVKNQSAINIVQEEWFKISSLVTANPQDVEDYLDAFEDMSSALLQYVVNMTDASGNTAMHYAVSHGNFDVVSILLDSKVCDINKSNKAGYTSVMLVSLAEVKSQTHANVVRRLFQLADVNVKAAQHGQTALMLSVSHGRLDMVQMLLEAGADINIQDEDGSTALMCAAEHGHIEIVKHFLCQPDCDSSITDVDGSTALKIAMEAGHRHIGVLLYAHERNLQKSHTNKLKKTKSNSPKSPSSPRSVRSSHRALNDTK